MAKYVFPAVFTKEKDGGYSVEFPDISGCFTCGDNLLHSIEMAEDALSLMLYHYEEEKREMPLPSERIELEDPSSQFVNYITCDTIGYQKRFNNKAIKKTLTIPEWLNEAATNRGLNFSSILQKALKRELDIPEGE